MSAISARQHLRFDTLLGVFLVRPRCWLSKLGPRAFSVAGRRFGTLYSLVDSLRDPDLGRDGFRRLLKTHLFTLY